MVGVAKGMPLWRNACGKHVFVSDVDDGLWAIGVRRAHLMLRVNAG